jgi:hypothetical protein
VSPRNNVQPMPVRRQVARGEESVKGEEEGGGAEGHFRDCGEGGGWGRMQSEGPSAVGGWNKTPNPKAHLTWSAIPTIHLLSASSRFKRPLENSCERHAERNAKTRLFLCFRTRPIRGTCLKDTGKRLFRAEFHAEGRDGKERR